MHTDDNPTARDALAASPALANTRRRIDALVRDGDTLAAFRVAFDAVRLHGKHAHELSMRTDDGKRRKMWRDGEVRRACYDYVAECHKEMNR
jgi:hypothetical protein